MRPQIKAAYSLLPCSSIMSDKKSTALTPKAQHPERTQKFVSVVAEALEAFEDSIGSLEENIQASAYETFIN